MKQLEEEFRNIHLLGREDRLRLIRKLEYLKPEFLRPYYPKWWWWRRCTVKVLIVTDGGLNFGTGGFGLSEFLTTFNQLQGTTWSDYQLTLGHRSFSPSSTNPLVVNQINEFNFKTSVNVNDFDQVWLFGIVGGGGLSADEREVVEAYMDGGGGLFATGDHGNLGSALCGNIARVKDMRYWDHIPPGSGDLDSEVSMDGRRRNDTNRPRSGDATSMYFDNQSDEIPQTIAVRTFGGGTPHPLLSISKTLRPSGIIDIMPDHPHEGECKPETVFTVNSVAIPTQIIATSFVLGGSTTNGGNEGKTPTEPHCFPSIAVWDGREANAGRIVVDSTWHHFVNINLNGTGSTVDLPGIQPGLTAADFNVIQRYYMNIATWMTRRRSRYCWWNILLVDLLRNSQLIEASLDRPLAKMETIHLADLKSIGALAEELLATRYSPVFARELLLELLAEVQPGISGILDVWRPVDPAKEKSKQAIYQQPWLNLDPMLYTAIGAGFIALRDDQRISGDDLKEEDSDQVMKIFAQGMDYGLKISMENLNANLKQFNALAR